MRFRVFCFALLLPLVSRAQVAGRLTGSVFDSSGAAIPGATVDVLLPGGTAPVLSAQTTTDGLFHLTGVRPDFYDLSITAKGFVTASVKGVKVDPSRETVVPTVRLDVSAVTTSVDVKASPQNVQTANAEVSTTITKDQVHRLPVLDRYALDLVTTQAGVVTGRSATVMNGLRTTYSNVTLDGINVQDNLFRENGLDFIPNLLQLDQVAEVTISTSNTNATMGGGASQVNIVTPSGTNEYHGALLWYNRNNALAASDWFDNRDGVPKAFLNQNILGGSFQGPIRKDKLLFYTNYEAIRLKQNPSQDHTILTADARNGIFTYRDAQGALHKANILQAAGVQMDPAIQSILTQVPGPEHINNPRVGDGLNTAGYSFGVRDNDTRDNVTAKLDYIHSTRHVFTASYIWNRNLQDRGDFENDYAAIPKAYENDHTLLLTGAWRWNPTPAVTNELRVGANLAPGDFKTRQQFGSYILDGFVFDNPVNTFRAQGRVTNTYSIADNATYVRGKHSLQYGFQSQLVRVAPYDDAGITPTYSVGIGTGNPGLTSRSLPGIRSADLSNANALLASLAGYIESYSQDFNITSRASGFVNGATYRRHFTYNNYAGYLQDAWKVRPRLTLTLGLRYDYFGVVNERDGLTLMPVLQNKNPIQTLLSNATFDFAGSSAGRPFYNKDLNNFAPNLGLAWDVFGTGRTALRAGYSINYVDDNAIATIQNNVLFTNAGTYATSQDSGLTARVGAGLPQVVVPVYKVPRTQADNYTLDSQAALGMPNPNLRTPYVQQWNLSIEQEVKGALIDVRYVGNHATKSFRAFDYNQVVIRENGFLADFLKARNNGNLARAAGGAFDPRYNANIPGSQPLPVFNQLTRGGTLTQATIRNLIDQGQVGELAARYQIDGLNGSVDFFRNPYALGANMVTNYSNSTYNALQIDVRRRTESGLQLQANYTFSKVLSDALGDTQVRFEPFLDFNNARVERGRAPYDITHAIKANGTYELPFGEGHRINYRPLRGLLGGWSTSGVMTWQSGTPFSILSTRGTLNRGSRSSSNPAVTTLTGGQLDQVVGFYMTGNGPYFANPSILGPDGRAVGPDGAAPYAGQVFFNPAAGSIGSLQRRMFSGPWLFNLDLGLQKTTKITERQTLELRLESTNALNHPSFFVGDETQGTAPFNINSPTFGQIASTMNNRRVVQIGLYYRF